MTTAKNKKKKKGEKESLGATLRYFGLLALFALILRNFIVAPNVIPSGSMMPTMWVGDYLFTAKWPYGYSQASMLGGIPPFEGRVLSNDPDRGDVVVFRSPVPGGGDIVKRVIGLPGDRIEIRAGRVILNGEAIERQRLEQDFVLPRSENSPCKAAQGATAFIQPDGDGGEVCLYPQFVETLPEGRSYRVLDQVEGGEADDRAPVTVPDGHFFMMGDNRDDSSDSRYSVAVGGVGMVPRENLIGEARFNYWSSDGSAHPLLPWTWFTALRPARIGKSHVAE